MIYFRKDGFSSSALSKIMSIAAFQNPEFYQKQATRQSTHETPRVICCAENLEKYIALPRACWDDFREHLVESNIKYRLTDKRAAGKPVNATFKGQLRDDQAAAVAQITSSDFGVICASTAFGKTIVANYIISERKTNTLILVHTLALVDQWKERIQQFLEIPSNSIGQIGGGKKKRTGIIDFATITIARMQ